jgi:hypothetical protein
MFPCEGVRDAESERAIVVALEKGGWDRVTGLYRRGDVPEEQCWLRGRIGAWLTPEIPLSASTRCAHSGGPYCLLQ